MRHFERDRMAVIQTYPEGAKWLKAAGKGYLVYFNVHDVQPEVVRGLWRAPWFSYLADTVMERWGAYLISAAGDTARYFAYGGTPYLINWAVIDSSRAERLVTAQKLAAGERAAAFWDVYFPELRPWMFHESGASYSDFGPELRRQYQENFERALRIARRAFADVDPALPWGVLVNGSWDAPPPLYLEGMEQSPLGSFADAIEIWRRHPANVASVRASQTLWVDSLIGIWAERGGIIAFTQAYEHPIEEARAYEKAEAARE
jgi:hypothetical protein